MAPHVPPLDLQRVGGGAAAAEGAGHLHVLARPRRHVVGRLCEQGCAEKRGRSSRGSGKRAAGTALVAGRGGEVGAARPAGGAPGEVSEGCAAAAGQTGEEGAGSGPRMPHWSPASVPEPMAPPEAHAGSNGSEEAGLQGVSKEARRPGRKLPASSILPDFSRLLHPAPSCHCSPRGPTQQGRNTGGRKGCGARGVCFILSARPGRAQRRHVTRPEAIGEAS